jgi:phosphopentomutase
MGRAIILVMDSFGIGATADAERFGDSGADTLGHIARAREDSGAGPLRLPNLARLGLFHASRDSTGDFPAGVDTDSDIIGAYGFAAELSSSGKDTPSGHWEIAGVPVLFDWGYFTAKTDTFPKELLDKLIDRAGLPGVLGNCHASGTTIVAELGDEHVRTGKCSGCMISATSRVNSWMTTTSAGSSRVRSSARALKPMCAPVTGVT